MGFSGKEAVSFLRDLQRGAGREALSFTFSNLRALRNTLYEPTPALPPEAVNNFLLPSDFSTVKAIGAERGSMVLHETVQWLGRAKLRCPDRRCRDIRSGEWARIVISVSFLSVVVT